MLSGENLLHCKLQNAHIVVLDRDTILTVKRTIYINETSRLIYSHTKIQYQNNSILLFLYWLEPSSNQHTSQHILSKLRIRASDIGEYFHSRFSCANFLRLLRIS